ncbi:MAG: cohesin domain-containing protein, partial [Euryarchaeota archaeon]|nr:cohesin domain-containing protein [Euryarchaeota archaeon]
MYRQKRTLKQLAIVALILTLSAIFTAYAAAETTVYVDAPDYVLSDTFDVEIKIEDVYELDSGEFHLLFDPNVVDVTGVTAGDIGNMNVAFTNKRSDKVQGIGIIKVTFDISGTSGVSGSGSLATVSFEVIGSDGTCSILNISNTKYVYLFDEGELWDGSAEEMTAKWENGIVCIGHLSLPDANVTIFVENRDDDDLSVELFIDGDFEKQYEIKKDANETYYEGLILPGGLHAFKIEWYDHDTTEDYVKTEDHSVSGTTAVTLMTDKHTEDDNNSTGSNTSTPDAQDTPEAKVTIFVENRDDDDLFVKLSIDGDFEKQYEISDGDNEKYCDGRRLSGGRHTFTIEWHDHDTNEDYVKTEEHSVSGTTAITLMTDEHTEDDDKLSAHVYVKNLDDDDLDDVYLYIDEVYWKYKSISSGSVGDYGEYEFEEDENALHSFKIEWFDPGTDVTHEKIVRSYITTEEAVTLYVDKHTEED